MWASDYGSGILCIAQVRVFGDTRFFRSSLHSGEEPNEVQDEPGPGQRAHRGPGPERGRRDRTRRVAGPGALGLLGLLYSPVSNLSKTRVILRLRTSKQRLQSLEAYAFQWAIKTSQIESSQTFESGIHYGFTQTGSICVLMNQHNLRDSRNRTIQNVFRFLCMVSETRKEISLHVQ